MDGGQMEKNNSVFEKEDNSLTQRLCSEMETHNNVLCEVPLKRKMYFKNHKNAKFWFNNCPNWVILTLLLLLAGANVNGSEFPDRECCDSIPPPPPNYHQSISTTTSTRRPPTSSNFSSGK